MEKIIKMLMLTLCVLLCGCSHRQPQSRLVTGIHVQAQQQQVILDRTYTDPEKMEAVLYYLRALEQRQPVSNDPERYAGRQDRIELTYSDGTTRQIFQRCDQFLSEDLGPWQTVDRKKAAFLYPLLKSIPSD